MSGPSPVPSPNNFRYVQVRTADPGADSASVQYRETAYVATFTPVSETNPAPTPRTRLRNYPNPFNPRTTIEFTIPGNGNVDVVLDIYDIRGRMITALFDRKLPGGSKGGISWDGKDDKGRPVPSGIYFCRAKIGEDTGVRKMLLLR